MAISLDKLARTAPGLVNLAKGAQVNLTKRGLAGHRAKVALCLDHSGSMRKLYKQGVVQALAERVLALATQIDDDGAIDVFAFGAEGSYLGELTVADFAGGVDRLIRDMRYGTTNYAAVMELVRAHYRSGGLSPSPAASHSATPESQLGRQVSVIAGHVLTRPAELPAYVMFVTDGAPDSRSKAARQIVEASREGIFWQFMGVGGGPFDFLRRLDASVPGRLIDNAGFFEATDPTELADDALYAEMLSEYPSWLREAKRAGVLRG